MDVNFLTIHTGHLEQVWGKKVSKKSKKAESEWTSIVHGPRDREKNLQT